MALPVARAQEQSATPTSDDDADRHRDHRAGGQVDRPDLRRRLHGVLAVGPGAAAERELEDVAGGDADADRHDHHRRQADAPASERSPDASSPSRPPATMAAAMPRTAASRMWSPDRLVEVPGHDGAEGDELAVGEVGQPGRAVDQRQADGADGDDEPELDAVGDRLREDAEPALLLPQILAEEVVGRLRLAGADVHRALRRRVRPDRDALGERRLVERHLVVTGAGQRDLVGALGVRRGVADGLAGGVGDRDLDAGDRVADALAVLLALVEHPTADGLGRLRRGPPGCEGHQGHERDGERQRLDDERSHQPRRQAPSSPSPALVRSSAHPSHSYGRECAIARPA